MHESSPQLKVQEGLILVLNRVSGVLCVCPEMTWKKKMTCRQTYQTIFFHIHVHKLDVIPCKVDSPMMSPTSQRWSSKPQVIMVATVSLTMANTSTFIPCSDSCAVTNRTVSVSNLRSSAQSNDSHVSVTSQDFPTNKRPVSGVYCTPVLSIASLRVWTTSLPRRPRTRKFLLQFINNPCRQRNTTIRKYTEWDGQVAGCGG